MKSKELPDGWVVAPSTSLPNRVYYFNTRTKESSWEFPVADMQSAASSKSGPRSKKRKREDLNLNGRPTTPDLEDAGDSKNEKNNTERSKLRAKRTISTEQREEPQAQKPKSKDTPQMEQLKQKMLQRQAAGNAPKKSKFIGLTPPRRGEVAPVKEEPSSSVADNNTERLTPQMRVIMEKMKQRELSGPPKVSRRRTIASTGKISSPRRPKTRSIGSIESQEDTNLTSPIKSKIPRLGRSAKKNLAQERLEKLQRSLTEEQNVVNGLSTPGKPGNLVHDAGVADASTERLTNLSSSIYKNADVRAKSLRDRLENKVHFEKKPSPQTGDVMINLDTEVDGSRIPPADSFYEDMEWEPIEDEKIMKEIHVVRSHIGSIEDSDNRKELPHNSLDLPDGPFRKELKPLLYIVIDTNVFLSNLSAVEEARDAVFQNYGPPLIVIPWTVIRELDFIKDDRSMSRPECLRAKARQAVRFLHSHFESKHPRILGQTPFDVADNKEKFKHECPDDEILQTCLQIRSSNRNVVLLSYDKNLCNKAMIHDLVILGRHDPLEKVDYLYYASDARNNSFLSLHLQGIEQNPETLPPHIKERRSVETFMEEAKNIIVSFMTVIVAKELQNLYNNEWIKHAYIRPPWSVYAVLQCAIKHWIAVVSDSFVRRGEPLLKELLQAVQNIPETGRKFADVNHILELISDVLQCVKEEKYPNLVAEAMRAILNMKKEVAETAQRLNEEKINDTWEARMNAKEEQERALRAFHQFEEVYAFTRDVCGLASTEIGMSCSFTFKKLEPEPTREEIKDMQPEVAANLNRLLQVLGNALEEIDDLRVNKKSVDALYHALSNFMPERRGSVPADFEPLDVFWCLKKKEKELKLGLVQLQELSTHFCRMASFRCT